MFYQPQTPAADESPRGETRRERTDEDDGGDGQKRRRLSDQQGEQHPTEQQDEQSLDLSTIISEPSLPLDGPSQELASSSNIKEEVRFASPSVKAEGQGVQDPSASQEDLSAQSPGSNRSKIGANHVELMYETQESMYMCRMCQYVSTLSSSLYAAVTPCRQRKRDAAAPDDVACYPLSAGWDELVGHCEEKHPAAFDMLAHMSPSDISEMRQRINSKR
ncbi:hypothetical protein FA95DRAFT_280092 [Auriscalpium vulgare]|uniref:Uncharacterized protein n=1 Tax=Auriscalpium vulgare TaxID=40419 RepID=A0ACB8S4Q0_9AGAM|nr:hypothetical protein FA95DRAFT_280092 [Auriscalpium vulgare]